MVKNIKFKRDRPFQGSNQSGKPEMIHNLKICPVIARYEQLRPYLAHHSQF